MEKAEREIEAKLRDGVRAAGGLCLKWVCPGWAGVPDRIILLPGGRVIFAETKRPKGGEIAARQAWWARKLRGLGFLHYFVWDALDVERVLQTVRVWDSVWGALDVERVLQTVMVCAREGDRSHET